MSQSAHGETESLDAALPPDEFARLGALSAATAAVEGGRR